MGTSKEQQAKAGEMLEEMIKSTHRLDEILQHMCTAEPQEKGPVIHAAADLENVDTQDTESEEEFQDCIAVATSATSSTPEEYFQSVRNAFGDGTIEIPAAAVDIQRLQSSLHGTGDLVVRFATCTRDTSFVFSSAGSDGPWKSVAASPQPEYGVSYSHFLSQLRQQIVACDHIVPVERADAAAELSFLLLEEQQRRLLGAINSYFPYQREAIYWAQGNRVCEMFVQETQQDNQWGLLIQSNVTSVLRARVNKQSEELPAQDPNMDRDTSVSSCTRCMVFLPKTHYLRSSARVAFQVSIAISLAITEAGADVKISSSRKEDKPEGRASPSSDARTKDISDAAGTRTIPLTAELPEILSVAEWGTHDDNPILEDKNFVHPAREQTTTGTFRKVRIETPFPRNRIVQAACSRFHTLFLNDMGLVFAYGHTVDGALGLGYELRGYLAQPTLVDYFFDNLIVVQDISCGGDQLVGAHSAAVSQDGRLFTWGVGIALGRGNLRSASTPQCIDLPPVESILDGAAAIMPLAHSVSCGSGFCVALTRDGQAFSWGKWSDGRLGLGKIPIIARTSRRHGGGAVRKQFQSFQLTPKQIPSIYSTIKASLSGDVGGRESKEALFSKVACGDAHCVGLTRAGGLVTWGRGNNGQQGRGDASDTLSPTAVFKASGEKQWHDVAAGENWSMALSGDGQVWTWGACGGAVLGHGLYGSQKNALLAETILQRHQRLLSQRKKPSGPCPTLPCLKWMTPQMIPCFSTPDIRICRISAGVQHAAAISDTGDLYMWGEDYTSDGARSGDADRLVLSSLPKLVNSGQRAEGVTDNQAIAELGTHSVEHVMCGGRQTIALTSGSFLARSMNKLYHESIGRGEEDHTSAIAGADLVLIVSGQRIPAHKLLLAQRSPILRELILEEEEQQQNRRNRREDDGGNSTHSRSEPLELLLPRLRADIARALVEFIYTDNFTMEVSKNAYYLVNDVLRAAKLYKLPSLAQLCRERLFSASPSSLFGGGVEALAGLEEIAEQDEKFSDKNSEDDPHKQVEIPGGSARTLNDDMKFALSDEVWADTVLIAEGHRIPVHRCMLVARSEYFRAVLAFRRSSTHLTTEAQVSNAMAVVNVEDSYAGIVRVLRFIYYDQVVLPSLNRKDAKGDSDGVEQEAERAEGAVNDYLAEEASDQLLEDLVAADKYRLERMKRLCEHAICVTVANCLEVLAVAELVHAAHLKQVAMRFVQTHLAQITAREEEFRRFQKDFPPLLEELYASLRDASREEFLLREWNKDVGASLAAQREEQELQWGKKSAAATFPWVPLSLAVAFGAMYLSLMHAQEHEFTAVPATNLIAIAAICGAIMTGYL
ncbi:hypothetical protein PRIC2_003364 [Phytophthora ramorum]